MHQTSKCKQLFDLTSETINLKNHYPFFVIYNNLYPLSYTYSLGILKVVAIKKKDIYNKTNKNNFTFSFNGIIFKFIH